MRARYPEESGFVERDGVKVAYYVYGSGDTTVFLLPTWSLVHSRRWKMQIPYLARHYRVVTFDGCGNGRSDRPPTAAAYSDAEFVADAVAVMDATATERAVVVGISAGGNWVLRLAADHPHRVSGAIFISPSVPFGEPLPERAANEHSFDEVLDTEEDWAKYNRHYWQRDYPGFAEWFCRLIFTEPHSTKAVEDCVGWAMATTPETMEALPMRKDRLTCAHTSGASESYCSAPSGASYDTIITTCASRNPPCCAHRSGPRHMK